MHNIIWTSDSCSFICIDLIGSICNFIWNPLSTLRIHTYMYLVAWWGLKFLSWTFCKTENGGKHQIHTSRSLPFVNAALKTVFHILLGHTHSHGSNGGLDCCKSKDGNFSYTRNISICPCFYPGWSYHGHNLYDYLFLIGLLLDRCLPILHRSHR